ncbi:hypothetical protein CEY16_13120 [Halalkalibacillus sediminis]|uniref:Uncharacterized protein n=1 Tax=Halalkalibacillus sediminis TaxID=2018042 RepID=A0A2I0QQY7_9BACI|nr:hypothetical protein [Halalkalibacillus sediminis]PKR76755.1 hypothetical protein CEY16_13120 [Halalkalibacillus sediminis]
MRKFTLEQINETVTNNRTRANAIIKKELQPIGRVKRYRPRSPGEVKALNEISISRWNKAVEEGKIKKLGERSYYYDYN